MRAEQLYLTRPRGTDRRIVSRFVSLETGQSWEIVTADDGTVCPGIATAVYCGRDRAWQWPSETWEDAATVHARAYAALIGVGPRRRID